MPPIWHTFEVMCAGVYEREPRSRHQILNGLRHKHLRRAGERRDAGSNRHGQPRELAVDYLAFTGVHPRADLESELAHAGRDLLSALDRASGPVKRCIEAVARGVVLDAAPPIERCPDEAVMLGYQ